MTTSTDLSPRYELAAGIRRLNARLAELPPEQLRALQSDWLDSWGELTQARERARSDAAELIAIRDWVGRWTQTLNYRQRKERMPSFFTIGKKATYIAADNDDLKRIHKTQGDPLHYAAIESVSKADPELEVGSPLKAKSGHWFISTGTAHVMVEEVVS